MKSYKYDIAISLCQQDIEYAKALVAELNPGLNVFFYEDRQQELITKSGPEVFASIFKKDSRVVVILARKEWGESFYTDIERNAIIDRTSVKNEGYNFLFVIPIVPNEVPVWYPPTRIYADPRRFTLENMARFIEFKVTELGGEVNPISFEEHCDLFNKKIELKKQLVQLQQTEEAISYGVKELGKIKNLFNDKIQFLRQKLILRTEIREFSEHSFSASFGIGDFLLQCELKDNEKQHGVKNNSAQDIGLVLILFHNTNSLQKEINRTKNLVFHYSPMKRGWCIPSLKPHSSQNEKPLLYRNRDNQYSFLLDAPVSSEELIDFWFKQLFDYGTQSLGKIL